MTSEIEWRRRWKPDLRAKPWKRFVFNGESYHMKFHAKNDSYDWLLTDQNNLWHEELQLEDIKKRVEKYNPSVEVHVGKLLDHIAEYTDNPDKTANWDLEFGGGAEDGKKACLWLNTKLAGLPFCWKFKALPDETGMFKPYFCLPLMLMVGELQRQNAELVKLLRNKDKEIDDYKAQGGRVSRKHLETPQFDEVAFKDNMLTSKGFTENVQNSDSKIFNKEGQELYQSVMTTYAWLNRSPDEVAEGESLIGEAETVDRAGDGTSWQGSRVPPSLASANTAAISPYNSPIKGTQKSPAKSPAGKSPAGKSPAKNVDSPGKDSDAMETSPSKDTELLRRQALERRLEEEMKQKEQKAKKKKKLKL